MVQMDGPGQHEKLLEVWKNVLCKRRLKQLRFFSSVRREKYPSENL